MKFTELYELVSEGIMNRNPEPVMIDVLWPFREVQRGNAHDFTNIDELQKDIEMNGIKEPLIFTYDPKSGRGQLTDGNHRIVAAKRAGLKRVPIYLNRQYAMYDDDEAYAVTTGYKDIRDIQGLIIELINSIEHNLYKKTPE